VGVYNMLDKNYVKWADTPGIGRDAAERFTQPGVNFSAGIKFEL
jgi:outer membrane receptor protein involved in Fe transport